MSETIKRKDYWNEKEKSLKKRNKRDNNKPLGTKHSTQT